MDAFKTKAEAERLDAKSRLETADSKLEGIVLPAYTCQCPQTKASDLKQFEAKRAPLLADRTRAQDDLREIGSRTPPEPRLLPREVSAAVAVIISFGLLAAFLGTHSAAKRKLEEWTKEEEKRAKARGKTRRRKLQPKAQKKPEAKPWTPQIVANDLG